MSREHLKRSSDRAFCRLCRKQVKLKSFVEAADILKTNFNEIKLLAENFHLHRLHNARGIQMVCENSLSEVLEKRPTQRLDADLFKTNPSFSDIFFGEMG